MNAYEEKRQARVERLRASAAAKNASAEATLESARKSASVIPLGQPIMVGHYSEGRDRRFRARLDAKYRAGISQLDEAKELERRADAAERNTAVSSDDPEAVVKLRAKRDEIARQRELAVMVNSRIQHAERMKRDDWKTVARVMLAAACVRSETIDLLLTPDFAQRIGVPGYKLTNLASEQRRVEKRIAELESARPDEPTVDLPGGIRFEESDNRVRFFFPGKPDEKTREMLRGHAFLWAPSVGAWQRKATDNARYAAKQITKVLAATAGEGES